MVVVVGFNCSDPLFGEIKFIVVESDEPRLVVQCWKSRQVSHANAFELVNEQWIQSHID